jgi:hypothetical protein
LTEWKFAQRSEGERLAHVQYFSMIKVQDDQQIEFAIKVYEYLTPADPSMRFFAVADKRVNQSAGGYTPTGWGNSLLDALSSCMASIRRFPYDPDPAPGG